MKDWLLTIFTIHNLFLLSGAFLIYKFSRTRKIYWGLTLAIGVLWLATSTYYLPAKWMKYEESRQKRILPANHKEQVYIHVFGAGYILDKRLNPSQQLSPTSLTRLVEAVRLMKSYPNAVLVTSGHSRYGVKSQAEVARDAAISLGVPSSKIKVLTTPDNTFTEIQSFTQKIGNDVSVIAVSDALHLPRIHFLYNQYPHLKTYYAPTNYQIKEGQNGSVGVDFPSVSSIEMVNEIIKERLKFAKDKAKVYFLKQKSH